MKRIFLLLFVGLFFGCTHTETTENQETKKITLDSIINRELNTSVNHDTIFLGFTFGMSEKDFARRAIALKKEGKIYVHEGMVAYDMTIDKRTTYRCLFRPEYYEGELSEIGISVNSTSLISSPELMNIKLVRFFTEKYGFYDYSQPMKLITDCEEYYWVDGNRLINIMCGFEDARIFYRDLVAEKEKKGRKESEMLMQTEETKSDI